MSYLLTSILSQKSRKVNRFAEEFESIKQFDSALKTPGRSFLGQPGAVSDHQEPDFAVFFSPLLSMDTSSSHRSRSELGAHHSLSEIMLIACSFSL